MNMLWKRVWIYCGKYCEYAGKNTVSVQKAVNMLWKRLLICFLTPLLVLFLICLYISSRALSKAFEHRNFIARYQRETNHITVASCMPGNYGRKLTILVETFIYIINYIRSSKRENDLRTLQFFDFFYLKIYSFYSLLSSCICYYRKQKCRLTFLFCCFISVLHRSIAAL